jgi:peptidoglycan/LPS O-acetylase OafA/YrhL
MGSREREAGPGDRDRTTTRAVRFLAAAAVVWAHTIECPEVLSQPYSLPRFAVRFFAAASVVLAVRAAVSPGRSTVAGYATERFRRLYIPFAVWSVIYAAARTVLPGLNPEWYDLRFGWEWVQTGTSYHLWFLPFILIVSIGAYAAAAAMSRVISGPPLWRTAVALGLAVVGIGIAVSPMPESLEGHHPHHPILDATPAAIWGLGLAFAIGSDTRRVPRAAGFLGLAGFLASAGYLVVAGRERFAENVCGVSILVFCLGCPRAIRVRSLGWLGGLSYGVYLNHVLVVEAYQMAAHTFLGATAGLAIDVAVFLASLATAVGVTWILRRTGLWWLSGC